MTIDESGRVPRVRILIAEDQALVRRGTTLLLSMEQDMEVVGQACDGIDAVAMAVELRPDVVLMDLHMPRLSGVAATREITRSLPGTQVLVLTTLNDDETVFEAVRAGAHGYLLKDVTEQELLDTIRALRRGESRLTPQIARKVMDQFRRLAGSAAYAPDAVNSAQKRNSLTETPDTVTETPGAVTETLNDKEEKILRLITEGMTNRQIANTLFLAEGTVKNYVSRIMGKLHANTRTALAMISAKQPRID
jgi:DNA-binding NarL/FixJ family response regulator